MLCCAGGLLVVTIKNISTAAGITPETLFCIVPTRLQRQLIKIPEEYITLL